MPDRAAFPGPVREICGLVRALSYAVVLVPFLTCLVSLLLGTVGATLIIRAPKGERRGLLGATILASLPGLLLFGYVAYAFVASR